MATFSEAERAYLSEFRLGRLATVGREGQPHVVPVGFTLNEEAGTIDVGGHAMEKTRKFRDVQANPHVAIVIDDIASMNPWRARGVEIRGMAETLDTGGEALRPGFGAAWIRIAPTKIISWGLDQG